MEKELGEDVINEFFSNEKKPDEFDRKLDDPEYRERVAKPLAKGYEAAKSGQTDRGDYYIRYAQKYIGKEHPHLMNKFPVVYSMYQRAMAENPRGGYEDNLHSACDMATDYLGLRETAEKRKLNDAVSQHEEFQNRIKSGPRLFQEELRRKEQEND